MPKHKDRPFSKKNSVTFKLVHRSQQDPLIADDSAPQFVLHPSGRQADHSKFGIYYDDDYDYMQHLKSVDELDDEDVELVAMPNQRSREKKLMLPSSLFESAVQNPAGMLSGSALPVGPQPEWDPDIVAAMDEDFDFENPDNELEDDFVQQALAAESVSESDRENERRRSAAGADDEYQSESDDKDGGESDIFGRSESDEEEKRSCFTSYSMTSSVMRRNAGLSLLDQQFETLFEKEYGDESEIGPVDGEEIDGRADPNHSQLMKNLIRERSEKSDQSFDAKAFISPNHYFEEDECDPVNGEVEIQKAVRDGDERFDCESILSTYSNLYHHPKLIYEPKVCSSKSAAAARVRVNPKTGIPVHTNRSGLTACNLKRLNAQVAADETAAPSIAMSQLSIRAKDESAEEKRTRKSQVREQRRERRQEKKANRQAFIQEDRRQNLQSFNVRNNLSAIRLV